MCGIIGYIGKQKKTSEIVEVLKRLEYRGYDSAGVYGYGEENATENGWFMHKAVGNISNLEKIIPASSKTKNAIAHTRWATHGKPTTVNAHPHSSFTELWTIVHNGIVENYQELRKMLKHKPESQTDTVVVAEFLEEKKADSIQDFILCFKSIVGSYAIVAENKNKPNELFLAKNRSPLYASQNEDGDTLVASDPICFAGFSKSYYTFENGEFAHVQNGKISFFDAEGNAVCKKTCRLEIDSHSAEKNEFPHFMIKEIMEQPEALLRQVKTFEDSEVLKKFDAKFIKKFNCIKFIGCGTAYNAGLVGSRYIEKLLGIKAYAEMASEFIYSEPVFADKKSLFIFVSQSGETADTLSAHALAKSKGATTIALTNVLYSTLAKSADYVIPVCAGPEIAVASTKAYVCQLSALYMFACSLKNSTQGTSINYTQNIKRVAKEILNFDKNKIDRLAEWLKTKESVIFIGKDIDYVSSCEASLKLKEVSYIGTSNYPSGELKHGYLALVEEDTPLVVFAGNKKINQKTYNSASEAVSRGAMEILFTNEKIEETDKRIVFYFSEQDELLLPMLTIAPVQYLAYKVSTLKGINPDQPRNLAKSVTVE